MLVDRVRCGRLAGAEVERCDANAVELSDRSPSLLRFDRLTGDRDQALRSGMRSCGSCTPVKSWSLSSGRTWRCALGLMVRRGDWPVATDGGTGDAVPCGGRPRWRLLVLLVLLFSDQMGENKSSRIVSGAWSSVLSRIALGNPGLMRSDLKEHFTLVVGKDALVAHRR